MILDYEREIRKLPLVTKVTTPPKRFAITSLTCTIML